MSSIKMWCFAAVLLPVAFDSACAACSSSLAAQIISAERVIDSLRPDKAGQMRVFASDGSEYTAGEAMWMKGQLKLISQACAGGDETAAQVRMLQVSELIKAHEHRS